MDHTDYWVEGVTTLLDDMGKLSHFSTEELKELGESLQGASENEGMAFGYDAIPNPLNAEIERLERQLEDQKNKAEKREAIYKNSVKRRTGADSVYIEGNQVMYDMR